MNKEQEEIYHETIASLMKKLEERDELITQLRVEIDASKRKLERLERRYASECND